MTYEQLTGDLKGVTYSSIRAGLLEFRRACEQIQFNVFVHLGCRPTMKRWLKEAVMIGALDLPGYFKDPSQYENVIWVPPGWQWVDPQKEMAAAQQAVRSGFTSRTMVVRETGQDPEEIDAQQAEERARAAELGITYDSDPNKVLIGRETQPDVPGTAKPTEETRVESGDETPGAGAFGNPPRRNRRTNGRIIQ
jgi:lambda family phage portal protein